MTNGEYITKMVEQNEDFCILTDDVAETVTIEVSLDWWNKPKTDVLDKVRADVINIADGRQSLKVRHILQIIDKFRAESEE